MILMLHNTYANNTLSPPQVIHKVLYGWLIGLIAMYLGGKCEV